MANTSCQDRHCMITVPAEIEQEWRAGNQQALLDFIKEQAAQLYGQIRDDFNAQFTSRIILQ